MFWCHASDSHLPGWHSRRHHAACTYFVFFVEGRKYWGWNIGCRHEGKYVLSNLLVTLINRYWCSISAQPKYLLSWLLEIISAIKTGQQPQINFHAARYCMYIGWNCVHRFTYVQNVCHALKAPNLCQTYHANCSIEAYPFVSGRPTYLKLGRRSSGSGWADTTSGINNQSEKKQRCLVHLTHYHKDKT